MEVQEKIDEAKLSPNLEIKKFKCYAIMVS